MALDLSALEEKPIPTAEAAPAGKPMEIALADIEEDPNQPRTEFSEASMKEMTASIKERGVRQPVSVRPHPTKQGKWMLNFGARRFRGSQAAGKTTIPAFVDDTSDEFDQVIENEQRDNLKPMELALFIQRKLDEGMKKAEVARKLGKDAALITQHLALIAAPDCIEEIYRTGRCTSPKTLYELRALHDKFPEDVEKWCDNAEEVTRKGVAELAAILKGGKTVSPSPAPISTSDNPESGAEPNAESLGHDQGNYSDGEQGDGTPSELAGSHEDYQGAGGQSDAGLDGEDAPTRNKPEADPSVMKKPLMLVEYNGRAAAVLLHRRPSAAGLIHIRYEDGGGEEEVDGALCKINQLTDGDV